MKPLEQLIAAQSGVLTLAQARAVAAPGIVRGHLYAGRWRRVCDGILVAHNSRLDRQQQLGVAVLVGGDGAVLAGATALLQAGVRGIREGSIRVLIPAARSRSRRLPQLPAEMPALRVIRTRNLPAEHLHTAWPPRTTVARAAVDAAAWAPSADGARAVLAAACQQGTVDPADILAVLADRRRLPRHALIKSTLLDIAGGSQSLAEIDFMRLCRRFGLPRPDRQTRRRDASGRTRYLDVYWHQWHLHVEIDGAHHMETRQWNDDMIRQNQVWIDGDRILRFPANLIRNRPALVAGQLDAALTAAGWHP